MEGEIPGCFDIQAGLLKPNKVGVEEVLGKSCKESNVGFDFILMQ